MKMLVIPCLTAYLCFTIQALVAAAEDAAPNQSNRSNTPVFAFVALKSSAPPTEQKLRNAISESFPQDAKIDKVSIDSENQSLSFVADGREYFASPIGRPIPWGDLARPCENNWMWPDATALMRAHRNHYLVACLSAKGSTLDKSIGLTKAIAAITRCTEAAGVYWGHGPTVTEPKRFQAFADIASDKSPPLFVFLGLRMGRSESGFSAATTGMDYFGERNIEVIDSKRHPKEVMNLIFGLATIVLQGEEVPDGDTIGPDDATKIKVRHVDSAIGRDATVYRIEY